ncbi:MAG: hypothetical protein JWN34_2322 [Bryobacterales bacterium]|nr:hypothetical protein [Bryobacterales bacterium]
MALSAGNYPAAERGFQAVLKLEPRNVGALGNLGVVYSRMNRFGQAIDAYQRALRLAPDDPGLTLNLGLAYVKQEQFAEALPIFEKLPSNPRIRQLLVTCLVETGQNARALETLAPLVAEQPADTGLLYLQGLALTRLKKTDEAHEVWARMMASANPATANFLMGKASYETGSFEPAADYFRKALQADPRLSDAHRELGKTLVSLRDNPAAVKELRLADPGDAEALYFLGGVLAQENDPTAVAVLEKARAMNPDFWGSWYYLGKLQFEQGKLKESLVNLERAAKLKPDESAVIYQLGRAYQRAARPTDAQAAFEKVRQLKAAAQQKDAEAMNEK